MGFADDVRFFDKINMHNSVCNVNGLRNAGIQGKHKNMFDVNVSFSAITLNK